MRILALLVSLAILSVNVFAQEQDAPSQKELKTLLKTKIRSVQHMALNPTVIRATRRQNSETLTLDLIKQRDEEWKSTKELTHFKRSLQENDAGRFLKRVIGINESFNEAFVTDNQGANVAAFPATSDYWQGDEEKWTASFNDGTGKVFIGPLEYDDSTKTYAVQISAPLYDRGTTIGVLVVGVTLDYLKTRQALR
ncbi:MAG TPA: PDC sensor domain-containing protein [Gammaproteobacteria bacterium]|nr:PDC sensor domain-containing protein [Gammaproteobacteria bacterium]